MEPYSSLFLSTHVHRHDLKLSLGSVHVRFYLYVTPFDPVKSLRVVDLPNLAVLVRGEGFAIATNLAQNAGWLIGLFLRARVVVLRRVRVLPALSAGRHQRASTFGCTSRESLIRGHR